MRTTARLLALLCIAASAPARPALADGANGGWPRVGHPAPSFALPPLRFYDFKTDRTPITRENAGLLYAEVRLDDFRWRRAVALLVTDGTTAGDTGWFQRLYERYGAQVQFLLIYTGTTKDSSAAIDRMRQANSFVRNHDIETPCLVGHPWRGRSENGVSAESLLIDRHGTTIHHGAALEGPAAMERAIRAMLAADVVL